jgi:hypothetical protein
MDPAVGAVVLQASEDLLSGALINGAGYVVTIAGLAIIVAWVAYLFR